MAFVAVTNRGVLTQVSGTQPRALAASGPAQPQRGMGPGRLPGALLAAAAGVAGTVSSRQRDQKHRCQRVAMKQVRSETSGASSPEVGSGQRREITADTHAKALEFETSPRETTDTITELARRAGLKLEVKPWDFLSGIAQDAARGWFVKRAEDSGISWSESVARLEKQQDELDAIYTKICDPSLEYPSYYTLPFHGYDAGNLSWNAAHELEAATQSMCLGYYTGMDWQDAQEMFRGSARREIAEYWRSSHLVSIDGLPEQPRTLLDLGCSGGFSTNQMAEAFPGVEATGLDLSPYYLSVAQHTYSDMTFVHGRAESTGLTDASFDVVTLNFILHELPLEASQEVIREAYRLLAPGGVIAILDVDPRRLLELPPFRRWAFQVTEPWCKDGEYYALDLPKVLQDTGFRAVQRSANDPVNELVLATK
mmetsp:Transcript_41797/g.108248  ORF Transcript_41797/g.108248 Transcript_41797/m.108248 type:complete len:425 (+) Transcript_41797:102-1376(+)